MPKAIVSVLLFISVTSFYAQTGFLEGDIIFQETSSDFSDAIKIATDSRYSHCGIILEHNGELMVFEAVQPVKFTPIDAWINRGVDDHFVVKRLKSDADLLNDSNLKLMYEAIDKFINKPYDIYFQWSNTRIYCSELVFKLYEIATGLQVGTFQGFDEFYTDDTLVKLQLQQIYGSSLPVSEQFISPISIFNSTLLETTIIDQ